MTVAYRTLEHVACEARPYPTYLLENAETGLCLFSAAFMGHNDVVHFALEDVKTTCVDVDQEKLAVMASLYPEGWRFVCGDAWEFAEACAKEGAQWDAVSVDTFTGDVLRRSLDSLELWCSLARKVVTASLTVGAAYTTPMGWIDSEVYERATGVYWLVLERP